MTTRTLTRWWMFNLVGMAGAAVQLGVLTLLASGLHLPVPVATLLAVEAAILHNFGWHARWTWRDRPSSGPRETFQRFVRFQGTNGLVSLVGNVAITSALVAFGGFVPAVANAIAIVACSIVNYLLGDRVVFRTAVAVVAVTVATVHPASAQSPEAIAAWDQYVAKVDARYRAPDGDDFFALDLQKESGWRERARDGQLPMVSLDPPGVDDAKVHHWAGAIYVPRMTAAAVVDRLLAYAGRESEFYQEVKASRLLERDGDRVRVFMRLYRDAGPVEATYNSEHLVEYRRLPNGSVTSRSVSTKIAEIDEAGTPQEREKRPGDDSGFLWRLNAYWRFQNWGDGVLIECESVSLSRSVPFLLRPVANPIVNRIARESLANTLRSLRTFLTSAPRQP